MPEPHVPEYLRGQLYQLWNSTNRNSVPNTDDKSPFQFSNVIFSNEDSWKGLRTSATAFEILSRDVKNTSTVGEAREAATQLSKKLYETGAFSNVTLSSGPSSNGNGVDLHVQVKENRISLKTGTTQSLGGRLSSSLEGTIYNPLGKADSLSFQVGSSSGEVTSGGITDIITPLITGNSQNAAASVKDNLRKSIEMLTTPTITAEYRAPYFFDHRTPFSLRFNKATEFHDGTCGFRNKNVEIETSLTSSDYKHSLSHHLQWRNLMPLRNSRRMFASASSAEVVADCISSLKSSLAYSFVHDSSHSNQSGSNVISGAGNVGGNRLLGRLELAGLGGDVRFLKGTLSYNGSVSFLRFMPDTGFRHVESSSALRERLNGDKKRRDAIAQRYHGFSQESDAEIYSNTASADLHNRNNAGVPAPGAAAVSILWRAITGSAYANDPIFPQVAASAPARTAALYASLPLPYSTAYEPGFWHTIGGWLSCGFTASLDASAGVVLPLDRLVTPLLGSSAKAITSEVSSLPPLKSNKDVSIQDRFFIFGSKLRGFDSIGPRALSNDYSTHKPDLLGGELMAVVNGVLKMPPPIPSVVLSNSNLRSHIFASAGILRRASDINTVQDLVEKPSIAVGYGLNWPLAQGLTLETNWTLWRYAQPSDEFANFKIQFMA